MSRTATLALANAPAVITAAGASARWRLLAAGRVATRRRMEARHGA